MYKGPKLESLLGKRFGRLVVIAYAFRNKHNHIMWKCKCDCGNYIKTSSNNLKGGTKSCGCLAKEIRSQSAKQWNFKHGMNKTKFYICWNSMKQRCNNKHNASYKRYGGRGIIYDLKWEEFKNFKSDMYFKYIYAKKKYKGEKNLSLERINVNGNYCFENCDFILKKDQYNNLGNQKWFKATDPIGKKHIDNNLKRFCDKNDIHRGTVYRCLKGLQPKHKGWRFEYLKGGDFYQAS